MQDKDGDDVHDPIYFRMCPDPIHFSECWGWPSELEPSESVEDHNAEIHRLLDESMERASFSSPALSPVESKEVKLLQTSETMTLHNLEEQLKSEFCLKEQFEADFFLECAILGVGGALTKSQV